MHGHMWLLYIYENEEYIIEMQNSSIDDEFSTEAGILKYFDYSPKEYYMYKPKDFSSSKIKEYAYRNNLKIYKVIYNENDIILTLVDKKVNI